MYSRVQQILAASDDTRYSKRIAIVTLYILASEHLKFIETWAFLSGLFVMSSKDTRKGVMSTMQLDLVALLPSTPTRKKNCESEQTAALHTFTDLANVHCSTHTVDKI